MDNSRQLLENRWWNVRHTVRRRRPPSSRADPSGCCIAPADEFTVG
ncbi:hypothetical protein HMPREF9566_00446 [Cutibacterium acnes HL045PA1]|nr:hypothetical protein HMPREF9566_00446 [Cutibacterium acnes HL045PA1]